MMKLAKQKHDFSDDEIDTFQKAVDNFFVPWVHLTGLEGQTNYIHMLGSGHFKSFLEEWHSLYRYEQQGWESLNMMVTSFWHH